MARNPGLLGLGLFLQVFILAGTFCKSAGSFTALPPPQCLQEELDERTVEWQNSLGGSSVRVEWGYSNKTCSSVEGCFGLRSNVSDETSLVPQLMPLEIQQGVQVVFFASRHMDVLFKLLPYRVDQEGFEACNTTYGVSLADNFTDEVTVSSRYLQLGSNYFIAVTTDGLYKCLFGLRLNITVKAKKCSGVGETVNCWNRGRCVTHPLQPAFTCSCCHDYAGQYCQAKDPCAANPCENKGQCEVIDDGVTSGLQFRCRCPLDYTGPTCQVHVDNLCELNLCETNSTCVGNSSEFHCACAAGFTGHHCEVNINDCSSEPCLHGLCVDRVGGYQCFCVPGYGGPNCRLEYNECQSNPCRNDGVCIDSEDAFRCDCGRGYTGDDCSIKVDLCNPNPCEEATECVDYGRSYSCTCKPGYQGHHCEINVNECESNPCQHGGKCRDKVAGYTCTCAVGWTGVHCEHATADLPSRLYDDDDSFHHRSRLENLYIVAGTLAGALLMALMVLAGCYCRIHETYNKVFLWRNKGYTRHRDTTLPANLETSSIRDTTRPSVDAIMEATTSGYHDNSLNAPLVSSLKPKRI